MIYKIKGDLMKKSLLVIIAFCLLFSVTSCSRGLKSTDEVIDKIINLPQDYSIKKAEKDGFVVINSELNVQNKEIDDFISGFYSRDKQLITIDENHIINFYHIKNHTITLFSYDQKNRAIIHHQETFGKIELNQAEGKAELCLSYSKGISLTSTGEKHVIYAYEIN